MNFFLKFLPSEIRALVELGMLITSALDTPEERSAVIAFAREMLTPNSSGGVRCTVGEWSRLGSKLGILTNNQGHSKRDRH
jgi:hypothetical protein